MISAVTIRTLDTAHVYTSLAHLTPLESPLTQLIQIFPECADLSGHFGRNPNFSRCTTGRLEVIIGERRIKRRWSEYLIPGYGLGLGRGETAISNLDMGSPSSELTIIRGPVSSEKSTTLPSSSG